MNADSGIDSDERRENARTAECGRAPRISNRDPSLRSDDEALPLAAREAGAGAGGHPSGVALRAIVGLVAGHFHFEQSAGSDVEFEAPAAAIRPPSCSTTPMASRVEPPVVQTSSITKTRSPAFTSKPRRSAIWPERSRSTKIERTPRARATSWPIISPPRAGETTQATL